MPKRLSDTHRRIFELADQGMPNVQIARLLACNRSHISRTLRNAELRASWEAERTVGTVVAGDSHLELLAQARHALLVQRSGEALHRVLELAVRRIEDTTSLGELLKAIPVFTQVLDKTITLARLHAGRPGSITERRELRADVDVNQKLRDALRELREGVPSE